jgi:hypothetical protein
VASTRRSGEVAAVIGVTLPAASVARSSTTEPAGPIAAAGIVRFQPPGPATVDATSAPRT